MKPLNSVSWLQRNVFHRRVDLGKCSLSGSLNRPTCVIPLATKRTSRVEDRHRKDCQDNHGRLQDHKGYLVIGNGSMEALLQLRNTVHRADEDEHNRRAECILEPSESLGGPQVGEASLPGALPGPAKADRELHPQSREDEQRDDLEHDTGYHDGPSCVTPGFIVRSGCESSAAALEDEGDEVACHESDCVRAWTEAGDFLAVDDDDAGEAEVEGAGEEGGGDR